MEAVCIVGIKLFGIIPQFLGRNTINAKNAEELTTNFQSGANKWQKRDLKFDGEEKK
jgi:hypothetical protein